MPYTRVSSTTNAAAALKYAEGHGRGHNGNKHRNLSIATVGLLPSSVESFARQFDLINRKSQRPVKVEAYRIVISYSPNELDAKNPKDVMKAELLAKEFVQKVYSGHKAAIFVQNDGKGGKLHTHIILSNVNTNHRALNHHRNFKTVKVAFNKVAEEAVDEDGNKLLKELDFGEHKVKDKHSVASRGIEERPKRKKPVHIHDEVLKPLITDAMKMSCSREQFRDILNEVGVEVDYRTADVSQRTDVRHGPSRDYGDYILYKIVDIDLLPPGQKPPRNLAAKSYKLGDDYGITALDSYIEKNNAEKKNDESEDSLITDYDMSDICFDDELSFEMLRHKADDKETGDEETVSVDEDSSINNMSLSDADSMTAYKSLVRMKNNIDIEEEDLPYEYNKEIE